ncbi:MAG: type I glyceraldehyde-3-phosphate dehydrogenase, partial [Bacteriovorax sp.]|nr:type I glyceraldehyde-3-phosphate dehydrogenase [Bacteriovorax sp.]
MKVAINGFGRIGRVTLRALLEKKGIEVVAINDLSDTSTLAHLFKYDSVHRSFKGIVTANTDEIIVNGKQIRIFAEKDPLKLPWQKLGIDLVIESTGKFTTAELAKAHVKAGAKQVIISAPSEDKDLPTVVLGVNEDSVDLSSIVLSNASCTTNNVATMVKVLDDKWGVVNGYITTVHSMTGDQNLHDSPHKDL